MAPRWLRRWCKPHFRHGGRVFEDEEDKQLVPIAGVSRAEAAQYHNSTQRAGSLYQLPEDLLSWICRYLTTDEVLTLMLSCTEFWRSRNAAGVFARTWQQITLPVGKDLSKLAARFHVLRMLEYGGLLQRAVPCKYCCWGCMEAHERRSFCRREFRKKANLKSNYPPDHAARRSCEPAKRCIWVGACREMSFAEIRQPAYATRRPRRDPVPRQRQTLSLERFMVRRPSPTV